MSTIFMPPGDRLGLGLTAEHGTSVVINVHAADGELLHICVDMRF
jgi:serine acetyltransferase